MFETSILGKNHPNYHKKYYQNHREEILAISKQRVQTPEYKQVRQDWTEKNREQINQKAKEYFHKNKKRINKQRNERRKKHWLELVRRLGSKCVCCGFSDIRALQIDHINGGGGVERRKRGGSIYSYIVKLSDKELKNNYQILCANCNTIKMREREEYSWKN